MPEFPGWLNEFLASPLVLPASAAGALAALFLVATVMAWRRAAPRPFFQFAGAVLALLAVVVVIEKMSRAERDAVRHELFAREAELTRTAIANGSPLACLVAGAGETVEAACEKSLFANAQSVAAAVSYIGARLNLLTAAGEDDGSLRTLLAATRRAIEIDRFGIAAHVLATRDGCTADKCEALELVDDPSALKANLKARVFDQYVSRYAAAWDASGSQAEQPPAVSSVPGTKPVAGSTPPVGGAPVAAIKPGEPWDYPSAASIPAVSIMNAEPPAPKGANGTPQPGDKQGATGSAPKEHDASQTASVPAGKPTDTSTPLPLNPPKRQQATPASPR